MKMCLVVDDIDTVRIASGRLIKHLNIGFDVNEAEDGEQALEMCKKGFPDLILLDREMPNMDGFEFLRELRKLPGGEKPKVIFCTGSSDATTIARALHEGANEFLVKPFTRAQLEEKLREVGLL